ncbi:MAG: hypothetical protein ACO1O1_12580 [Adhaeribacter sp.]
MKLNHFFLFVFLFCTTYVFASNSPSGQAVNERDVFAGIIKDKDFWRYLESKDFNTYPVVLKHADKVYVMAGPGAALKELPGNSLEDQPVFTVTCFKIKQDDRVVVKISYQNKKLLVKADKLCCSKWAISSLFAREAGGIKPELYSFK